MSSLQHNGGGFFCFLHSSTADIIVRMNYLSTLIYLNYGSHMEISKKKDGFWCSTDCKMGVTFSLYQKILANLRL